MVSFDLRIGDCREVMAGMAESSVDSIVTDPPYELGFMDKKWDATGIAYDIGMWRECLRVLKPGAHLLAFSGSRTYHRMVCAIEDAGFDIRDQLLWLYGSGFPKSHNIDPFTLLATQAEYTGYGTALKPAHEPICLARKPLIGTMLENVLEHGTGPLNIDGCRIDYVDEGDLKGATWGRGTDILGGNYVGGVHPSGKTNIEGNPNGRWPANVLHDGSDEVMDSFPAAPGQMADASTDAEARKTQNTYGAMKRGNEKSAEKVYADSGSTDFAMKPGARRGDKGSAGRFFYCAKASKEDRDEGLAGIAKRQYSHDGRDKAIENAYQRNGSIARNHHPTVKPTDLMRYLCRLITPPGGTILDPFMGSGSTGKGACLERFNFIGIDLDAEYKEIAQKRIDYVTRQGVLI